MIIKEFISQANKNQMISILFKHYKVESVKIKQKSMKRHADFDVDRGVLNLSTKYKTIKPSQIREFLITIIHEIDHARDAKKFGFKKFKEKYEYEQNMIAQGHYPGKTDTYWDNPYEIKAEKFGQDNWKKWYDKFKKQGLF